MVPKSYFTPDCAGIVPDLQHSCSSFRDAKRLASLGPVPSSGQEIGSGPDPLHLKGVCAAAWVYVSLFEHLILSWGICLHQGERISNFVSFTGFNLSLHLILKLRCNLLSKCFIYEVIHCYNGICICSLSSLDYLFKCCIVKDAHITEVITQELWHTMKGELWTQVDQRNTMQHVKLALHEQLFDVVTLGVVSILLLRWIPGCWRRNVLRFLRIKRLVVITEI